jgi:hypothetical protein
MDGRKGNRGQRMFPARDHRALALGKLEELFTSLLAGLQLGPLRRRLSRR